MPKLSLPDETDRHLLESLQKDSQISHQELGALVGLSTSAVNERVRRLSAEGLITGYHAKVNPKLVGLGIGALLFVAIDSPEHNANFVKRILEMPEVQECDHVTGQFSYFLRVLVRDTDHLEQLLTTDIKSIAGVTRTETILVLSSPKNLPIVDCLHNTR
jgi:Lrp/AsnC family leucine-responsive transcriptional regulator